MKVDSSLFTAYVELFMTKEASNGFKGVLALVVMTEHVLQHTGFRDLFSECPKFVQAVVGSVLEQLGIVPVACFFMLSGYGLRVSADNGGVSYARSMFRRKIIPFFGIVLISAIMYFLMFAAIGSPKSMYEFVRTFGFGGTIIVNGWFLQVILAIYLLFASIYSLNIRHGGCINRYCPRGILHWNWSFKDMVPGSAGFCTRLFIGKNGKQESKQSIGVVGGRPYIVCHSRIDTLSIWVAQYCDFASLHSVRRGCGF